MTRNPQSMSLPSRLALWLGVGFIVYGFYSQQPVLTIAGNVFILVGGALWWLYEAKGDKHAYAFWTKPFWNVRVTNGREKLQRAIEFVRHRGHPPRRVRSKQHITHKPPTSGTPTSSVRVSGKPDQRDIHGERALKEGQQALADLNDALDVHEKRKNDRGQ